MSPTRRQRPVRVRTRSIADEMASLLAKVPPKTLENRSFQEIIDNATADLIPEAQEEFKRREDEIRITKGLEARVRVVVTEEPTRST